MNGVTHTKNAAIKPKASLHHTSKYKSYYYLYIIENKIFIVKYQQIVLINYL